MKSKAQILAKKIDKIFEERGLKEQEAKRKGIFAYIPSNIKTKNLYNQERR